MKKIKLCFLILLTALLGTGCDGSAPLSETTEPSVSENTSVLTETAAAETAAVLPVSSPAETTTSDDRAPGHFDTFPGRIMLDGELREIYPLDAFVLIETEEGYFSIDSGTDPILPFTEKSLSALLTEENRRGVSKKVTDEAEKNGTLSLIQNELETDFEDGMDVYFDGEDFCLLIKDRDTEFHYFSNVLIEYEQEQADKERDPETYREKLESGKAIPYDVPNLDPEQIWYGFFRSTTDVTKRGGKIN